MDLQLSLLLLLFSHLASSMLLGWVESPGYPNGYLPHASLNWTRCARKGHVIAIKLIHLDLEDSPNCENDAVKVGPPQEAADVPRRGVLPLTALPLSYRCSRMEGPSPFCAAEKDLLSFRRP